MHNIFGKLVRTGLVCGMLMMTVPMTSMAAIGPGFEEGTYIATITADSVNINKAKDSEEVLTTAKAGDTYEVLEDLGNGWMKIRVNDTEGYLPVSENALGSALVHPVFTVIHIIKACNSFDYLSCHKCPLFLFHPAGKKDTGQDWITLSLSASTTSTVPLSTP